MRVIALGTGLINCAGVTQLVFRDMSFIFFRMPRLRDSAASHFASSLFA